MRVARQVALGYAEAAAVEAGPAAVRHQAHLLDEERVAHLEHLGRHHAAIAVDAVDRVVAVGEGPAAPACRQKVIADIIVAAARIDAAEQEVAVRRRVGSEAAIGPRLRQRADHRVGDARMRLGVAADRRRREVDVHHGARRRDHLDRPEAPGVLRDRWVGAVQDGVEAGRPGHAQGGVDGAARLLVRAGEVDDDLVALDMRRDDDLVWTVVDAVILHAIFEMVMAVGKRRELGAHALFGIVEQVLAAAAERLLAVLPDDLDQGASRRGRRRLIRAR